jgi:hypothetical protein
MTLPRRVAGCDAVVPTDAGRLCPPNRNEIAKPVGTTIPIDSRYGARPSARLHSGGKQDSKTVSRNPARLILFDMLANADAGVRKGADSGSRYTPNWWQRCGSITSPVIVSDMAPNSCGGAPTRARNNVLLNRY